MSCSCPLAASRSKAASRALSMAALGGASMAQIGKRHRQRILSLTCNHLKMRAIQTGHNRQDCRESPALLHGHEVLPCAVLVIVINQVF